MMTSFTDGWIRSSRTLRQLCKQLQIFPWQKLWHKQNNEVTAAQRRRKRELKCFTSWFLHDFGRAARNERNGLEQWPYLMLWSSCYISALLHFSGSAGRRGKSPQTWKSPESEAGSETWTHGCREELEVKGVSFSGCVWPGGCLGWVPLAGGAVSILRRRDHKVSEGRSWKRKTQNFRP